MGDMADMALDAMMDDDERFLSESHRQRTLQPMDEDGEMIPDPFCIDRSGHERIRARQIEEGKHWEYVTAKEYSITEITGKYLFFSEDRELLLKIARTEIRENGFKVAKVSRKAAKTDHVLCLYWVDNSRKRELAGRYRHREEEVRYRYWKSDADTRAGIYSNQTGE